MQAKKRILPALVFSAFAAFGAAEAQSAQFSNVYVFGDSLSDAGYYRGFLAGLGLPAPVVAQLGRFTTNPGPVWSELVSTYYGVTPAPSNAANGNIFAQGGARVSSDSASTPPGSAQRPVSTQISEYLARGSGAADPNALYAVWAGGNDFLQNFTAFSTGAITQAQLQTNVLAAATAEIGQIGRLRAAGARYILVFGLPDIGGTPFALGAGAASAAGASALSAGFNTTLFTGLQGSGLRVIPVDVFSLFNEVRATPGAFGITNVTGIACGPFPPITSSGNAQFCLPSNLVAPGAADSYLFADGVHPTSAAHRIIAQFVTSLIEGPTQYGLLAEAALRTRAAQIRAIGEGVTNGRQSDVGKLSVFAGADTSDFDIEQGIGNSGVASRSRSGTFGVTARVSEAVTIGGAYGHSRNRGSFGGNAGGYTATEHVWSIFFSAKAGGFYGTGVLSYADLEFGNVHRILPQGTGFRTATANAEGSNGSAYLTAGYDFAIGRLTIGPTVAVMSQNVDVNGFDEAGAGTSNLRLHQQKRRSEVWSGGLRASYNLGSWTPWLRVTADKERRDDVRLVSATPLTMLAVGSSYDIPAYASDTDFMTASLGITGYITPRVALSVAAFKVQGRSGIDESGVNAMVSVKF